VGWGVGAVAAAEIGPDDDFCAAINQLQPGEELRLRPGDYQGPCVVRRGGSPGAPTTISAADPQQRPRILYDGVTANVLEVRAGNLVIRGLEFGPTRPDVDAIRIMVGHGIVIENCRFFQLGGLAISANNQSVDRLVVRGNVIQDSRSTAMYFGCHDGLACAATTLLVEGNYIRHVTAAPAQVGYGIEIKLNSSGVVRDNIVLYPKGPGIMVYGSRDLLSQTIVERNLVIGSQQASGIVVGGGPALVRNNISISNNESGIALEDYGRRGILRRITVAHNTLYRNTLGAITVPNADVRNVALLNNAVHSRPPAPALPSRQPGLLLSGNIDCTYLLCFVNPDGLDFSPSPGSALLGSAAQTLDGVLLKEDFSRASRGLAPTVGAIERETGPLSIELRP
jgi:hypothetical protein